MITFALPLFSPLHSACPLPPLQLVAPSPKSLSSGRASSSKSETASADGVGDVDDTENEDDDATEGGKGSKSEGQAKDKAEVFSSFLPIITACETLTSHNYSD